MMWVDTAEEWALNVFFCIAFLLFFSFALCYAVFMTLYYLALTLIKQDRRYLSDKVKS